MERFGLGHEALLAGPPRLVVASSSGNGSKGPESLYAGLASIFAAVGGVSEQTGYADVPPTLIGESPDFRSGNLLAVAVLAALVHRRRTGQGQFIDLSSTEVMTVLAPYAFLAHTLGAPRSAGTATTTGRWPRTTFTRGPASTSGSASPSRPTPNGSPCAG